MTRGGPVTHWTIPAHAQLEEQPMTTFVDWLLRQTDRDDPVADLAADVRIDIQTTDAELHTAEDVRERLAKCNASPDAVAALDVAEREWAEATT
jgi:hypothetical protein